MTKSLFQAQNYSGPNDDIAPLAQTVAAIERIVASTLQAPIVVEVVPHFQHLAAWENSPHL
jgi:hypothetical protein